MKSYKIVIIGGGNVAYHLIKSITFSGHKLLQIYNRTLNNINQYNSNTSITGKLGDISLDGDIYIVCVKDTAISEVVKNLKLKDKLIVHTSGNMSMDLLKNCSENYGVFYPIQSFTKNIPMDFKKIPLIIEANNPFAFKMLHDFSSSISKNVIEMNELDRQKLNVAGVFANNFTNHLFAITHEYMKKQNLDFNILLPLIQNTVDKLTLGNPYEMQTGPAVRNDKTTIKNHLEILKDDEVMSDIYKTVSKRIQKYHKVE